MNVVKKCLALLIALAATAALGACAGNTPSGSESMSEENANYTISIHNQGGRALADVEVYIYAGEDLKQYGKTDAEGKLSFSLPENAAYSITLSGLPKGYDVAEYYSFDGTQADITLNSAVVQGESLSGAKLNVGDVMYDISVTTPAGEEVALSRLLEEKEVVVLNFWYTTCSACISEFPYMQAAYEEYEDSVGIIAVDPLDEANSIAEFQAAYGLTFPMASCSRNWTTGFNVNGGDVDGYPTTVIIDRYGVICLIEEGALVSQRYWTNLFEHFTGEDYEQILLSSVDDLMTQVTPMYEMPASEEIAAVLNTGDLEVSFRGEADDEYSWPFIVAEKNGESCLKASNQEIEGSYSILYADIYLEAGQAVGFDYLSSTEKGCDILHVIVEGEAVYSISGVNDPEVWESCYPWVAEQSGTYEVALCYIKDSTDMAGDDTVYLRDLRVVDQSEIDTVSYIPKLAATTEDGIHYTYAELVFNEKDGYYHVGTADGPLLLANLMTYSQFNEEKTIWDLVYNGDVTRNGQNIYDEVVDYFSYATNSSLYGYCTVDQGLAELLQLVADNVGFSEDEYEWLKICKYYQVYGPSEEQLVDPIKGLADYCAYEAKLGVGVESNYFYYDRPIMPRGLLAAFTPEKSGVYRITSHSENEDGVEAWIFGANRSEAYTYEWEERLNEDDLDVTMYHYMEAGETYYIDIAFWDIYAIGYIYYDIEYVAPEYDLFRRASPGFFTTDENMFYVIAGGIDVVLGEDGFYYEDKGVDANGKQLYGSKLYADFSMNTAVFSNPIATGSYIDDEGNEVEVKGMIELGAFDFSKTENDLYVLAYLEARDFDVEATDEYFHTLWGEDYDAYAQEYQLDDVYAGIYHGRGEDYTEEMRAYLKKMITSGKEELIGCVPVDARLGELLQMLMDKYTFSGVEHSWTKVCYYYKHLGSET